ncbi:retinol dehydrogenase 11-like isoform X2 [Rhinatrema bivittatum]|uniref:retinol dehydrogenase 11-like isoform X2 n=1 Tax=Rhinatrema bivittatum TaxID=194408 RepID=UPI001129322F|nr:retinol dehydrogenase 11-like isoform X2 [Rhinatrema bivittatum]
MELSAFFCLPSWFACSLVLALVLRAKRKGSWHPRQSSEDLAGKTAIVTGANTGIGKYIALDLAQRNARVLLACRSRERGQKALEEIQRETGNQNVALRIIDTSSMASVRMFAEQILQEEKRLDILVNNAGASGLPVSVTSEGLEITYATNYFGPFLLTNLLLDLMKQSASGRIVNVSSLMHKKGKVNFKQLKGEDLQNATRTFTYSSSKLMNILFTNELAGRLQGTGVTANSVHPGIVRTEVMRYYGWVFRALFHFLGFFFFKSPEEGAVSSIYCAVSEEVCSLHGSACIAAFRGPPRGGMDAITSSSDVGPS